VVDVVVAVDAGGTKLLGGLVTSEGEVVAREQRPTPRSAEGCDPGLSELVGLARSLADTATRDGHVVRGTGIGIAEYVKSDRLTSAEVFAWDRQPVDLLADLADGPVCVDGDVRCAALAEVRRRPGLERGCLAYVSWGTGLSSALVVDGVCLEGRRGEALALGEWPVHPAVDATWPGNLEQFASGRGIGERFGTEARPATGAEAAAAADAGDERALAVVTSAARAVAGAVAAVVQLVDPDLVVLGGGVGTGPGRLPDLVAEAVPAFLHRPGPPPVERALAGADAGLVGAGLVGWRGVRAS
jgi:glucokinase